MTWEVVWSPKVPKTLFLGAEIIESIKKDMLFLRSLIVAALKGHCPFIKKLRVSSCQATIGIEK